MNDKGTIVQQLEDELDHLRSQLQKIVEAGEPFRIFYQFELSELPKDTGLVWRTGGNQVTVHDFRRLDKALKEVKDE